jgi:hypothetical protein
VIAHNPNILSQEQIIYLIGLATKKQVLFPYPIVPSGDDNTRIIAIQRQVTDKLYHIIHLLMSDFDKFKFIFSSNDLDICKMCILGVNKLHSD